MKITMIVKTVGGKETWDESLDTDATRCLAGATKGLNAQEYGQLVIDYFNSTLKPGELPRELVGAHNCSNKMPTPSFRDVQ